MTTVQDRPADDWVPPAEPPPDPDLPRQDIAAEQSVLGAVMLSAGALEECSAMLGERDFYRPAHREVWASVARLHEAREPVDPITVAADLDARGRLSRVGGSPYLHTLVSSTPTAANAGYYAGLVSGCAVLRRLAEASARISQVAREGDPRDVQEAVVRAHAALDGLLPGAAVSDWTRLGELFERVLERMTEPPPKERVLPLPYARLNELLDGGLRAGQFVLVGGRPGWGKSVVGLDWCRHVADAGGVAAMVSLEMSLDEVADRAAAADARIDMSRLRSGTARDEEVQRFLGVAEQWETRRVFVADAPSQSMAQVTASTRRLREREGRLDIVVVDYLQLVSVPTGDRRQTRSADLDAVSRSMKVLGKELGCPVVAMVQLNREVEKRADKHPQISDLREAGGLEQDADLVLLLWPEELEGVRTGTVRVLVAKHRNGPLGEIELDMVGSQSRMREPSGSVLPWAEGL